MTNSSPEIEIKEIRVSTKVGLALKLDSFQSGLNVIRGDNSTGRTTLLKLIEFGLGSPRIHRKDFIPEISKCDKVVLEVRLGNHLYTFERRFWASGRIEVYRGAIEEIPRPLSSFFLAGQDISEFILSALDIPSVAVVDEMSGNTRSISFFDVLSLIYLDQETGFSSIHARLGKSQRLNVFKLVAAISVPEAFELTLEQENLRKQSTELDAKLSAIRDFLQDINLLSQPEIIEQKEQLVSQKNQLTLELAGIRTELRSRPDYADPMREVILQLEEQLSTSKDELFFSRQSLKAYEELENQLLADLDKSERVLTSSYILQSFDFEQCPRCLQEITMEMNEREIAGDCSLCGRSMQQIDSVSDDIGMYKSNIQSQLTEVADLISSTRMRIRSLNSEIERQQSDLSEKRIDFDRALETYVSPVIRNIEVLSQQIADVDVQLASLTRQQTWRQHVEQMEDELQNVQNAFSACIERQKQYRELEKMAEHRLQRFTAFLREFLIDTYPEPIESVKLHPKNYLPIINKHRYDSRSATEKNIAIAAYFYAQLRFSLEETTHFPQFLIIDTLRQDDLDPSTYNRILGKFKELENKYGKTFQVIIVTRDLVDLLHENEILQLVGGRRLLTL